MELQYITNIFMLRAEEENELFLKASLFMFQCFLSLLISLSYFYVDVEF